VRNGSTCKNGSNQTVGYRFTEFYRYTQAGLITGKRVYFISDTTWPTYSATIPGGAFQRELTYNYNSLGQQTSVTYPGGLIWNSQTQSYDNVATGRSYTHQYDSMLRPLSLVDSSSSHARISNATYGVADQLTGLQNFAGLDSGSQPNYYQETRNYNG